jgi:DNA-binding GntR family transcriptional regulator
MSDKLIRSPIYQQLHDQLRQILSADYEVGQQFLTEREVSERFGVSRTTANKTISSLVSEGL